MLLRDLKEELEDQDYEVLTAKNGQVALELLQTEKAGCHHQRHDDAENGRDRVLETHPPEPAEPA
ncbi:hypothetical protein QW131_15040 [Roseibium salinum]|nr:hypothetical protein [Roseibium salinum]